MEISIQPTKRNLRSYGTETMTNEHTYWAQYENSNYPLENFPSRLKIVRTRKKAIEINNLHSSA